MYLVRSLSFVIQYHQLLLKVDLLLQLLNINTLAEITIDGTPIPNFSPDQETYEITVPEGTSSIEIDATKGDEDHIPSAVT